MSDSISRQFGRWAAGLTYEDLPPAVVDKVKALLLLHLVAGVFGAVLPRAQEIVELVKAEDSRSDGATILGDGARATRQGATLANTEIMHVSGLYDSFRMITHPGPVLCAVALVNGELGGKSVKEVITALAAGYEFECRLAYDFVPSVAARGFRPAPVFTTMGAAMVAAKLFDLDEDGMVAAIAIAASSTSGLNEGGRSGGGEMAFHEPNSARQGVFAATMANTGHVQGSELVIEGEAGFYNAYAGNSEGKLSYAFTGPRRIDLATITEGLGSRYLLETVMFRMYPTAGYNQPVIDLMAELKQQHDLDADDIEEVVVSMNLIETLYPSPEFPRNPDPQDARVGWGTQYFAAHAAVNGGYPVVGGATFGPTGDDLENDERVLDFMANRVRLVPVWGQPMFSPAIDVRMKSGMVHSGVYPYERMAFNFDQAVARMQDCVPGLPGGQERLDSLVELMRGAEELDSLDRIFELTMVS